MVPTTSRYLDFTVKLTYTCMFCKFSEEENPYLTASSLGREIIQQPSYILLSEKFSFGNK